MFTRFARSVLLAALLALLAIGGSAASVSAQTNDHLRCYKVKDSAKFTAEVDLDALFAEFGNESCSVKGKAKLLCVPVTKTVTDFEDKSGTGIPPTGYQGEELSEARLCYRVKCPKTAVADQVISDQFGMRGVSKIKSQMLCTPAVQGAPPPTTTTTLPPLSGCTGGSSWPSCSGDCSGVGPTHACEARDDMSCACVLPCGDLDPTMGDFCVQGGGCPVDSDCAEVAGVCACVFAP